MSGNFDMDEYINHEFDDELMVDVRFETSLAIRCVLSILFVVVLVIARQLYFI